MTAKPSNKTKISTIEIVQPFDRARITTLKADDDDALERKLSAATRLFKDRKTWLKSFERVAILRKLSDLMEGRLRLGFILRR